jgi:hypothetical protein
VASAAAAAISRPLEPRDGAIWASPDGGGMFIHAPHPDPRDALRRALRIALLAVALPVAIGTSTTHMVAGLEMDGADPMVKPSKKPVIEAAFPRESYRPGAVARLVIFSRVARNVSVQVFHAGTEDRRMKPRDEMYGTAVTDVRRLGTVRRNEAIWVAIPDSPSGMYFAKLTGSGRRVGYAPFVLRPRRLGENRVALVLPTLAWQAYNFRDDNGDGQADTWYASQKVTSVLLGRPFEQRGVPPNYKYYDQPFLRWLIANEKGVDYLAQSDVANRAGGRWPPRTACSSFPAITST